MTKRGDTRMIFGMGYISPRQVLRASTRAVRWQFWTLVCVGISMASVPVMARSDNPGQPDWLIYWPVATSLGLLVFNMGLTWQQLAETKRRIERLENSAADKAAIVALVKDIDGFGARFESYLTTVQTWTSKVEHAVNEAERSIARLDERAKALESRR